MDWRFALFASEVIRSLPAFPQLHFGDTESFVISGNIYYRHRNAISYSLQLTVQCLFICLVATPGKPKKDPNAYYDFAFVKTTTSALYRDH